MSTTNTDSDDRYVHTPPPVESNGTPKPGFEWGESTEQGMKHPLDCSRTDAAEMRKCFGISPFDPDEFNYGVLPDVIAHEVEPEIGTSTKATDCLIRGERDAGKSTFARHLAIRLMEVNDEYVVWPGSPKRSEWLPLKFWTTVWLPEHAEIDARWMTEDSRPNSSADLEEIVRDVRYYDDPVDLLEQIYDQSPGSFHVVYPDPSFSGCENLTERSSTVSGSLPFRSRRDADGRQSATPLSHWWVAFWLARTEFVTGDFMSLIFDEIHTLFKRDAKNDDQRLYDKVDTIRELWEESRRARFSPYGFIQEETDLHSKIRKRFKWRIDLADGTPNPNMSNRSSVPDGFSRVPMQTDLLSSRPKGCGLCYNQTKFDPFRWDDIPGWPADEGRSLHVRMSPHGSIEEDSSNNKSLSRMQFDSKVFSEWENQTEHRLYVNDPGSGWIDVKTGRVGADLESPVDGFVFAEPTKKGDQIELQLTSQNGETEDVTVAEIPLSEDRDLGVVR